ncbi:hypothetical protein F5Y17DRAFT_457245 [Xylariaceae sp. FL0594]|nr:hypothetical protein F5Y17DRAFT_457245 [Xylariaceae sp. FL0594]
MCPLTQPEYRETWGQQQQRAQGMSAHWAGHDGYSDHNNSAPTPRALGLSVYDVSDFSQQQHQPNPAADGQQYFGPSEAADLLVNFNLPMSETTAYPSQNDEEESFEGGSESPDVGDSTGEYVDTGPETDAESTPMTRSAAEYGDEQQDEDAEFEDDVDIGDEVDVAGEQGEMDEAEGEVDIDVDVSHEVIDEDELRERDLRMKTRIMDRLNRSRPASVFSMEVEMRLRAASPRERRKTKLEVTYQEAEDLTKADWNQERFLMNHLRLDGSGRFPKWRCDVHVGRSQGDPEDKKAFERSLPTYQFLRQVRLQTTIALARGVPENQRQGVEEGVMSERDILIHLQRLGWWSDGRYLALGDPYAEAYNSVRRKWETEGLWRSRWVHFPEGPWMHQEETDRVMWEEMPEDSYNRCAQVLAGEWGKAFARESPADIRLARAIAVIHGFKRAGNPDDAAGSDDANDSAELRPRSAKRPRRR